MAGCLTPALRLPLPPEDTPFGATGVDVERRRRGRSRTGACPRSRASDRPPASTGAPTATMPARPASAGLLHELERRAAAQAGEHVGQRPARRPAARAPIALSIALWRPTSSRTDAQLAVEREQRRWRAAPPVRSKASCSRADGAPGAARTASASISGSAARRRAAALRCARTRARALPHTPHDEVRWKRALGRAGRARRPARGPHLDDVRRPGRRRARPTRRRRARRSAPRPRGSRPRAPRPRPACASSPRPRAPSTRISSGSSTASSSRARSRPRAYALDPGPPDVRVELGRGAGRARHPRG